eukprot:gnl/Spiro4/7482_TR3910_c1_g1_i1.p1 gnl/Spiro4/7482_TR3910_c1_g1~~gnl/Spiro4/7482_TR3910_c1_g1_i1.p1  ORF type:complete len:217 (+),score=18.87 gnl/Spiro4/7482_TR3910_c1_g1_i1:297-947(+)
MASTAGVELSGVTRAPLSKGWLGYYSREALADIAVVRGPRFLAGVGGVGGGRICLFLSTLFLVDFFAGVEVRLRLHVSNWCGEALDCLVASFLFLFSFLTLSLMCLKSVTESGWPNPPLPRHNAGLGCSCIARNGSKSLLLLLFGRRPRSRERERDRDRFPEELSSMPTTNQIRNEIKSLESKNPPLRGTEGSDSSSDVNIEANWLRKDILRGTRV